jgi:hypothetical protein
VQSYWHHQDVSSSSSSSSNIESSDNKTAPIRVVASTSSIRGGSVREPLPVPSDKDLTTHQNDARRYLRALCRVYVADYICAGYDIPLDCADIGNEVHEQIKQYYSEIMVAHADTFGELIRLVLPLAATRIAATLYCWFAVSPDCEARFIFGKSYNEDENDMYDINDFMREEL